VRTLPALIVSSVLGAGLALVPASVPVSSAQPLPATTAGEVGTTYSEPLRTAIASLRTRTEVRTGYLRTKFKHWVDADGDGCNTRKEVLIAEVDAPLTISSSCVLTGGRWYSYYDRRSWTDQGRIDIDHMVPLAEAWDSGARSWTAADRERFANDLGDPRSLVGVTDTVNQEKSDQDPGTWLPPHFKCRYLKEYVAVKVRWRLTVDSRERTAMNVLALECTNTLITVKRAI
jgi:hypothetical protein